MLHLFNLYQIYYNKSQDLDKDCIQYSTVGREISPYYENSIIIDICDKNLHLNSNYIGVTSWRMFEKTKLTKLDIDEIIKNENKDIYWYSNYRYKLCVLKNNPENDIYKCWKILLSDLKIDVDLNSILPIFCNYWIIRSELFQEYVTFLKKIINILETNKSIVELCKNDIIHRNDNYPLQTFILEYCFPVWVLSRNYSILKINKKIYNKNNSFRFIKKNGSVEISNRCL